MLAWLSACNSAPHPTVTLLPTKTPIPSATSDTPTSTSIPPTATESPTTMPMEVGVQLATSDFITDVAKLSEAVVVPDGQEAEYAQKILAMYKSGEIQNFSDQVVPAQLNPGKIYKSVGFGTAYEIAGDLSFYKDVSLRPFRGVTLFNDGQGGFKAPVLWLQPDKTVGLIWFRLPQKTATFVNKFGGSIFSVINYAFNVDPSHYIDTMTFQDPQGCAGMVGDTAFCAQYMSPESISARDAAINLFTSPDPTINGFVPEDMTSGKVQFIPSAGTDSN